MLNDRDRDEREKERERQRQAFAGGPFSMFGPMQMQPSRPNGGGMMPGNMGRGPMLEPPRFIGPANPGSLGMRRGVAEEMARTSAIQRNVQPQNALMGAMYAGLLGPLMQG
jgi:hypothetical protein